MILIFSEENDFSTDYVMEWLVDFYKQDVIRINNEANCNLIEKIEINSDFIKFRNTNLNINEVNSTWFRRGRLQQFMEVKNVQHQLVQLPNQLLLIVKHGALTHLMIQMAQ
jgi:hypothetical protein